MRIFYYFLYFVFLSQHLKANQIEHGLSLYINEDNSFYFQSTELDKYIVKSKNSFGFAYLINFEDFYIGGSLTKYQSDKIIKEQNNFLTNESLLIEKTKDNMYSLLLKYKVFEVENIKLLLGIGIGYVRHAFNIKYAGEITETISEISQTIIPDGTIITLELQSLCNAGIDIPEGGITTINNLEIIETGSNSSLCNIESTYEQQVPVNEEFNLSSISIPLSFNFTALYEIHDNLDLGLSFNIINLENITINHQKSYINFNNQMKYSYSSLQAFINFKF